MNKVIAVNLNGNAYQLEEIGYDHLRAYLDHAAAGLAANPDRDEILADIEQAIADKFRAALGPHKTVVATRDVERIIAEMGPVNGIPAGASPDAAGAAATGAASSTASAAGAASAGGAAAGGSGAAPRRLYLIHEGAMIGGVCNGLAAYFGIDVSVVRVVFALATLLYGTGILAYLLLMFIVPSATTPEQKAAAQGLPKTAQEFIRRAKEGYYQGMRTWGDRRAHREWKRKFKSEMRGLGQQFKQDVRDVRCNWRGRRWRTGPLFGPPGSPGAHFVLKALEIVFVILLLLMLFHHGFWGWWTWHFGGMPWWLAILILILVFKLIRLPFKAAYYWGPDYYGHPWHSPLDSLLGLFLFVFLVWLLNRHVPAFHQFLTEIPSFLRYMADSIHSWWVTNVH